MTAVLHKKTFQELTTDELYELLKVRSEVFMDEQNCIYQDMDDDDQHLDDADVLRTPAVGNVEAGSIQSDPGFGEGETPRAVLLGWVRDAGLEGDIKLFITTPIKMSFFVRFEVENYLTLCQKKRNDK